MNEWMNISFDDLRRQFFATKPSEVDGVFNSSVLYYREYLLKKVYAIFEYINFPEDWDFDYFQSVLFMEGVIGVTDTDAGVLALRCSYTGINVFDHPTTILFANPVLGNFQRTIGADGVLIKLQFNYHGILTMINRYATLLAMCDSAISVNLMNSKVAFIAMAENKAQAETMKKMYDEISMGKPAVFVKSSAINNGDAIFYNRVKEQYIATDIQDTKRTIVNEFLTEIGINNANIDKRERLNTDEVNANDQEIQANVQHWLDNLTAGFNEVNAMFDMDISVRIREYRERGDQDESTEPGGLGRV